MERLLNEPDNASRFEFIVITTPNERG